MLKVEQVRAGYGRTSILEGMQLEVGAGEVVALLGRNGVGKTTTLRAVMGHIPVTSGRVTFEGQDLRGVPTHERARRGMAYVPQGRDIFPAMSVFDNLRVAAHGVGRKQWRREIDTILEDFPVLAARRSQRGGSLSGGQQQILALARVLIAKPRLILLDEPTEGIQPSLVDEIGAIIEGLWATRGISVILVEQNLDFAARLASRAYIIDNGQVVRELSAAQVLEDRELQHEYMGV